MKSFLLLGLLLISSTAFAQTRVECKKDDCLQWGWTAFNDNNTISNVTCLALGKNACAEIGWRTTNGSDFSRSACKRNDCFRYGWTKRLNANKTEDYTCRNQDCLKYGWTKRLSNGVYKQIYCIRQDCRQFGWHSNSQDHLVCIRGDCFKNGWTENTRQSNNP